MEKEERKDVHCYSSSDPIVQPVKTDNEKCMYHTKRCDVNQKGRIAAQSQTKKIMQQVHG